MQTNIYIKRIYKKIINSFFKNYRQYKKVIIKDENNNKIIKFKKKNYKNKLRMPNVEQKKKNH